MALPDHLALAIDFSDASRLALKGAFRLAEVSGAKRISVLYAAREVVLPLDGQEALKRQLERVRAGVADSAKKQMEGIVHELCPSCALPVEYVVAHGKVERVIPLKAKSIGATMLVLGTQARTGISRLVLGSIAESVLRHSELPTLITPASSEDRPPYDELGALTQILIAVDVARDADAVVRAGMEAATAIANVEPTVTLLSVTDVPQAEGAEKKDVDALRAEAKRLATEHLGNLARQFDGCGVPVKIRVEDGEAEEQIARVAEELGVRLIVLGKHGRGYSGEKDLGTTASEIVRTARVSVLVIPTTPELRA